MVCIIISQVILTLRTIFEGAWVPLTFMIVMLGVTIGFYIVLSITKMIHPEKFLDDRHDLNPRVVSRWWDLYKHPLTVKSSITKVQNVEVSNCSSLV